MSFALWERQVKKGWVVRWGGDLGLGKDIFGTPREEGQAGPVERVSMEPCHVQAVEACHAVKDPTWFARLLTSIVWILEVLGNTNQ